jgi:hypothetical protein
MMATTPSPSRRITYVLGKVGRQLQGRSGGHLGKFLNPIRNRRPALRALAIDMHLRIEPTCIIKSTSFDESEVGHHCDLGRDRGAAFGTEISPNWLAAVSGIVKRLELSLNRYRRFRDRDHDGESRAGLLLAVLAVTYRNKGGLGGSGVSYLTAKATTAHLSHVIPQFFMHAELARTGALLKLRIEPYTKFENGWSVS